MILLPVAKTQGDRERRRQAVEALAMLGAAQGNELNWPVVLAQFRWRPGAFVEVGPNLFPVAPVLDVVPAIVEICEARVGRHFPIFDDRW